MTRRLTAALLTTVLTGACLTGCRRPEAKPKPGLPKVTVAKVQHQDLEPERRFTGTVTPLPNRAVKLGPQVAGKWASIGVGIGDTVQAGQVVASLDDRLLLDQARSAQAALTAAEASVSQAQANQVFLRQTAERTRGLLEAKMAARKDLEAADGQLAVAVAQLHASRAQVAQAAAALAVAKRQQSYCQLVAPFRGVVARRMANVGDTADPATPILYVVDLTRVLVDARLAGDEPAPRVGDRAKVGPVSGRFFDGTVSFVSPSLDPATNALPVGILVTNRDSVLRDGQSVEGTLASQGVPHAVVVPTTALVPDPAHVGGSAVYRFGEGKVQWQPVTTGLTVGQQVQILTGLKGGEDIVVTGAYGLPDGAAVDH